MEQGEDDTCISFAFYVNSCNCTFSFILAIVYDRSLYRGIHNQNIVKIVHRGLIRIKMLTYLVIRHSNRLNYSTNWNERRSVTNLKRSLSTIPEKNVLAFASHLYYLKFLSTDGERVKFRIHRIDHLVLATIPFRLFPREMSLIFPLYIGPPLSSSQCENTKRFPKDRR